jgi:hypothetical protein
VYLDLIRIITRAWQSHKLVVPNVSKCHRGKYIKAKYKRWKGLNVLCLFPKHELSATNLHPQLVKEYFNHVRPISTSEHT